MKKKADYIKRIEIKNLWGRKHVVWDLHPDVNILSGVNGIGKSTIINRIIAHLETQSHLLSVQSDPNMVVTFEPEDATEIRFDVVRSFDRPLLRADLVEKIGNVHVKTELDWQIYRLQRRYLDYQVNMGNRMITLLTSGNPEDKNKAAEISQAKILFQDLIDDFFRDTEKRILRDNNEIAFVQDGDILTPYQLSSGEKQILVILLTVLVQDGNHCAFLMDEPEVSLHVEWQQRLISTIHRLNPHVQIILTTHSPAVIMDGWLDMVTEVSDIYVP